MKITVQRVLFIFAICLLNFSCSKEQRKKNEPIPPKVNQLFSAIHSQKTELENLSFPLWFNNAFIKENRIKTITVRNYNTLQEDSLQLPQLKKLFYFNQLGNLERIHFYSYYDGKEISEEVAVYESPQDLMGFSVVNGYLSERKKILVDTLFTIVPSERENDMFSRSVTAKKYNSYVNKFSGNVSYYLFAQKFWGALSVDSILKPNVRDWVIWGTPRLPTKKYHVSNKLNETNVTNYLYFPNRVAKGMNEQVSDLSSHKTFKYDSKGMYLGFIDSIFSQNNFLYIQKLRINYLENKFPIDAILMNCLEGNKPYFAGRTTYNIVRYVQ